MGVSFFLIFLIVFPGLGGALLLLRGVIGKRVGDRPHCRACAYELDGIAQGVTQCPECGTDLGARGAVRLGLRRRSPWLAAFGFTFMVLGAAPVVFFAAPAAFRAQPTWLLRLEAGGNGPVATNAMAELENRRRGGAMPTATVKAIAADLLARQQTPGRGWTPAMGEFVARAAGDGMFAQDQVTAFYTTGIAMTASMRDLVRGGAPTSVAIKLADSRVLAAGRYEFATVKVALKFIDAGGKVHESGREEAKPGYIALSGGANGGYTTQTTVEVPPGTYQMEGVVSVLMRARGLNEPLRCEVPLERRPVRVVGGEEPLLELATVARDGADAMAVGRAITPMQVKLVRGRLSVFFSQGTTPVTLVGNLMAEQSGSEGPRTIELLEVTMQAGAGGGLPSGYEVDAKPGLAPGEARLWFEPDIARAERIVGLERIWGERIDLGTIVIAGE